MKKNRYINPLILIINILLIFFFLIAVIKSYGWFNNVIEKSNITLNTGVSKVSFKGYLVEEDDIDLNNPIYSDEIDGDNVTNLLSSNNINLTLTGNKIKELILILEKDEESFDLDCSLKLEVPNYYNQERINLTFLSGYYISIKDATSDILNASDEEDFSEKIHAYLIHNYQNNENYVPLNDSSEEANKLGIKRITDETNNYCIYHLFLKVGDDYNILYTNNIFPLNFKIYISLAGQMNSNTLETSVNQWYYANSFETLRSTVNTYYNNDSITITKDINYYGDLIFNRPVKLYIRSGVHLNVYGNIVFSCPYEGDFLINTNNPNALINICNSNSDNGLLIINTPNANFEIVGKGLDGYVNGDFIIQNDVDKKVIVTVNENLESVDYDNIGLVINKASFYEANQDTYKLTDIYLNDSSLITIKENSKINDIKVLDNVKRVHVINYANIHNIDLSNMIETLDFSYEAIKIENFSVINNIYLPSFSEIFTFDNNSLFLNYQGNTTIIFYTPRSNSNKVRNNDMILYNGDSGSFSNGDIIITNEVGYKYYQYDDIKKELLIYYREGDISLSDEIDNIIERENINPLIVKRLIIKTNDVKVLTASDYASINDFINIEYLDLSEMHSSGNYLPSNAFINLTKLKQVLLTMDIGITGNPFINTLVTELDIPNTFQFYDNNTFDNIETIHYYNNYSFPNLDSFLNKSGVVMFVSSERTYQNFASIYPVDHEKRRKIVLNGEKIGSFYVRAEEDGTNNLVYYEDSNLNIAFEGNLPTHFDFKTITKENGEVIKIDRYGDYVFYNKITSTTNIIFNQSLKSIGKYSFANNSGLRSITIDAECELDEGSFAYCSYLTSVDVNKINIIPKRCFFNDSSLSNLDINNVTRIEDYAFSGTSSLYSIYLDSVKYVGDNSFNNSGINYVIAPDLEEADSYAFFLCNNIVSFKAPKLKAIGTSAIPIYFNMRILETGIISEYLDNEVILTFNNYKLLHWYVHTNSKESINDFSIYQNVNSNVNIYLSKLTKAKNRDITYYDYLKTYETNNLKIIGINSLDGDGFIFKSLLVNNVTLENIYNDNLDFSLSELGYDNYVFYKLNEEEVALIDIFARSFKNNVIIPNNIINNGIDYKITELIGDKYLFNDIIFTNVNLTLPQNLRYIDNNMFIDKLHLKAVKVDYVANIGDNSFKNTGISEINLKNIETLGEESFSNCNSLTTVNFGYNITSLGTRTFKNCTNLKTILLPGNSNNTPIGTNIIENVPTTNFKILVNALKLNTVYNTQSSWFGISINNFESIEEEVTLNNITYYVTMASDGLVIDYIILGTSFITLSFPTSLSINNQSMDVVGIGGNAFRSIRNNDTIKNIVLPANLKYYNVNIKDCPLSLQNYSIASTNNNFTTTSGILYNKDRSILIAYPRMLNQSSFILPTTVKLILDDAFYNNNYLDELYINSDVTIMDSFHNVNLRSLYLNNENSIYKFIGKNTFEGHNANLKIYVYTSAYNSVINNIYSDKEIYDLIQTIH